jgi:hypothetical protein
MWQGIYHSEEASHHTHVLAQPDIEKPFDMYYDASGTGIGGVPMQDGYVIAYASR